MSTATAALFLPLVLDTREKFELPWPPGAGVVDHRKLDEGDVTSLALWKIAAIEIKREDYAASVGRDRPRIDREVERLQPYRFKAIVVADDLTNVYRKTAVHPNAILGTISSLLARYDVPTIFCGNEAGAARVICGLLRRWGERVQAETAARAGA